MRRDTHRGWAYDGNAVEPIELPLARESTIEVHWGGRSFSVHGSPTDLEAFVAGHLVAEGYVRSVKEITAMSVQPLADDRVRIDVQLVGAGRAPPARRDNVVWGEDPRPLPAPSLEKRTTFSPDDLFDLARELHDQEKSLREAGPFHWAAVYEPRSRALLLASDLSRHSAVDKVLGKALGSGASLPNQILYSSGRVGEEMVAKAIRTDVGALATRSIAFGSAVDLAARHSLMLVGKLHPGGLWLYVGKERLGRQRDG